MEQLRATELRQRTNAAQQLMTEGKLGIPVIPQQQQSHLVAASSAMPSSSSPANPTTAAVAQPNLAAAINQQIPQVQLQRPAQSGTPQAVVDNSNQTAAAGTYKQIYFY
jgi:hypothetical protein